jgi:hypothetical protein
MNQGRKTGRHPDGRDPKESPGCDTAEATDRVERQAGTHQVSSDWQTNV